MAVQIHSASRLNLADLKVIDGVEFWDLTELPSYVADPADMEYTVLSGDRLDLLADRFYQEPILWWVIAWANDIELSPFGLNPGSRIFIPDPDYVRKTLLKTNTRR